MTEDLFETPESRPPLIYELRQRYNAALAAYEDEDADPTGELLRHVGRARAALQAEENRLARINRED